MQLAARYCSGFAFLCSILLLGGCGVDEPIALPWADAKVESLATLDNPWKMAFLPDGRLLITEKPGKLRIFADGKLSNAIGGVPKVVYHEQGGLLGVAVDPDFANNRRIYLSYTEAAPEQPANSKDEGDPRLGKYQDLNDVVLKGLAVARKLDGDQLKDAKVIWRQTPKTIGRGHFGGQMTFAPDGTLFITSGDRQRFDPAQDLGTTLGKIIRVDTEGSAPADNPFVNQAGAPRGEETASTFLIVVSGLFVVSGEIVSLAGFDTIADPASVKSDFSSASLA